MLNTIKWMVDNNADNITEHITAVIAETNKWAMHQLNEEAKGVEESII